MSAPPTPIREPHTWRCWQCGRILARVLLLPGCLVEVRCKCGAMNVAALEAKRGA